MQPEYVQFWPYLFALLAIFAIYRRVRRNFGSQPLKPVRMGVRIGLLAVIGCLLLPLALSSVQYLAAEISGLAAGLALGVWGAARTRYLVRDGRMFYVPHTYTGVAVSLVFAARLVYRITVITLHPAAAQGTDSAARTGGMPFMKTPLTIGLLFLVVGYYVYFYSKVLWTSKHLAAEDLEAA